MKNKNERNVSLPIDHIGTPRLSDPALWTRIETWHPRLLADRALTNRIKASLHVGNAEVSPIIREYLRFAYLAWTSPTGATPSKRVDEAWHAHLLFTRSYAEFCADTRGEHLHHEPGDGEVKEARFQDAYAATLQRYGDEFGEPPAAWWPPPSPGAAASRPGKSDPPQGPDRGSGTSLGVAAAVPFALFGAFLAGWVELTPFLMGMMLTGTIVFLVALARSAPARAAGTGKGKSDGGSGSSDGGGGYVASGGCDPGGDGGGCSDGGGGGSSCGGGGCGGG